MLHPSFETLASQAPQDEVGDSFTEMSSGASQTGRGGTRRHNRDNTAHLVRIAPSCAAHPLVWPASSFEINISQILHDEAGISSRRTTSRDSNSRYNRWNHTKTFAAEYLAGKLFDQKICSLLRDLARSNKRLGPSLLPINTARYARDTTPRTATGSMGEENEDDDFDDCRISADCFVYGSVRSRCRESR
jgi:hypothetical protein